VSGPSAWLGAEDARALDALAEVGLSDDPSSLLLAVRAPGASQAAAAHVLGARGDASVIDELAAALDGAGDLASAEVAFALARLGDARGGDALRRLLELPVAGNVAPLVAAGYLAELGDPSGVPVVDDGLGQDVPTLRVIAAKQLGYFVAHGIDVGTQLDRARGDDNDEVRRVAAQAAAAGSGS
jgi:HEAT repeat protein